MRHDNRAIIAESAAPPRPVRLAAMVLLGTLLLGSAAAIVYARQDLTLSHYDARGHLVVSRRITDSLTPGWRQIGAVWLPLPHLVNLPVLQSDWSYRTGYPSVALSVATMALGLTSLALLIFRRTGSGAAALAAPAVVLLNPNVLYLQSTPMTEPLLIGLSLLAVCLTDAWVERGTRGRRWAAGVAILALALTRYEGWFVAAALVSVAGLARRGDGWRSSTALAPFLLAAVVTFLFLGWGSTGVWFVATGFFERDPATFGQLAPSLVRLGYGTSQLGGSVLFIAGAAGAAACMLAAVRGGPGRLLPLALLAAALLPLYAFYQGHPYRVRYMVPVVVALAALSGYAIARLPGRWRMAGAIALVAATTWERRPFDGQAAMVTEAQWETPMRRGREVVTEYLKAAHDGTPILASMGSLAHYMQETSRAGFHLSSFLHEGNGDLWKHALQAPSRYVNWILIEERAEGGDMLAARVREDDAFLSGFARVAEGGGVALYGKPSARDAVVSIRSGPGTPR